MEKLREVNRRGQGSGLRREIVDAAEELLAESASVEAVTLRGIARRAGIAAPSIYAHFADRDAVLEAVVQEGFADLGARVAAAAGPGASPAARVHAVCVAYVDFADRYPGRYRVLFERSAPNISADRRSYPTGLAAFDVLRAAIADAVAVGTSGSADPALDAVALWAGLHGLVLLRRTTPGFPWPPADVLVARMAVALADLSS